MAGEMSASEVTREAYPGLFDLKDRLAVEGIESEPQPFDQYQGPYLDVPGVGKIWYDSDAPLECDAFLIERRHLEFDTQDADVVLEASDSTVECGSYLIDSAVERIRQIVKASR